MKKITSIAAIALLAVAFTSCKKDYSCECVDPNSPNDKPMTIALGKTKKSAAEAACTNMELAGDECTLK